MMIDRNEEKNNYLFNDFLINSEIEFFSVLLLLTSFFLAYYHQNLCLAFLQFLLIVIPLIWMYRGRGVFAMKERVKMLMFILPYLLYLLSVLVSWYFWMNPDKLSHSFSNGVYFLTALLALYGIYSAYPIIRPVFADDVYESDITIILFSLLIFTFFISGIKIYNYGIYGASDRYVIGRGIYPIIILSLVFLSRKISLSLRLSERKLRGFSLEDNEDKGTIISKEELQELAHQIENILMEEKLYLSSSLSLSTLSRKTNIPSYRLSYVFNHYFESGFYQTLGKYRIEYAMDLIEKNPNVSFDALAEKCGFNSRSTFYKYFKIVNSCTPKEYLEGINGRENTTNS